MSVIQTVKIIIAGGRDFDNFPLMIDKVRDCMTYIRKHQKFSNNLIEIVSGCAKGADQLGEQLANLNNLKLTKFPADWDKHGKSAGFKRNIEMAKYADVLIAFWDGKSKGTEHMIQEATKRGLILFTIDY